MKIFINLKLRLANSNSWVSLTQRMFATPRVLITLLAALWLPVCHCQFTSYLIAQATCCQDRGVNASKTAVVAHADSSAKPIKSCCQTGADNDSRVQHEENNSHGAPGAPCQTCPCCVTKAPPPAPVTIDACALSALACVLPPSMGELANAQFEHDCTALSLCQHDPPGPPLRVNQRCSIHSHWII